MSYTIKVEKTLMQIPLAKALPRQQRCAGNVPCKYTVLLSEGEGGPPGAAGRLGAAGTPSTSGLWLMGSGARDSGRIQSRADAAVWAGQRQEWVQNLRGCQKILVTEKMIF